MLKILLATHNKKKRAEIKSLLKNFKDIEILNFDDITIDPPQVVEDGKTFRQNAIKKAVITSKFFGGLAIADDSGLEVDVLGGKPGVRSSRFSRTNATDEENNEKLLKLLEKVPGKKRKAQFVCCIALAKNGVMLETFTGTVRGDILASPRGKNGFGYDPVFVPQSFEKTFAEMTALHKNRISHRAQALKQLKEFIEEHRAAL
ncbi:MAG: RdgB/HAM1 family non-canonical purine NTP pyrophosphatase [Candidatus Omnitrophica bacterium]|nr:RdgB/HAM1 family non-canonical purine NTP pyrophosphatase [Candidatus Omnitrophota bacterium]